MQIQELLMQRNRALFVGRSDALDAIRQHISSSDWKILHLHGPGGIRGIVKADTIEKLVSFRRVCRWP
jgi:hypothetical protein